MKRIIAFLFVAVMVITAGAQTNFREITYNDALAAAKTEGKFVFIDFMTDWCGPCKMMARDVFPQEKLGKYMNDHFVSIKINAEKGEGIELSKTYKVNAYPTFIVIDANKKEFGRVVGGRSAAEFEEEMERLINPEKSPELVTKRYNEGDRSASTVKAFAALKMRDAMKDRQNYAKYQEEAVKIVQDYFGGLTDKERLAADNLFVFEEYTKNADDPSAKFLVNNLSKFSAENKDAATKAATNLFNEVMLGYFTGYKEIKNDVYEQAKKDIKRLKLDKDGSFAAVQGFIDMYVAGDMDKYIEYVDKNFDNLPDEKQQYLANTFSRLFEKCDEATKKKAARCLRNHLSNLPYNVIYFSAMEIGKLEGVAGH